MTRQINTRKTSKASKSRFSHLALALALSVGTVGGMATFAALTEPAFARGSGGGGGAGGGAAGGEGGNPAAVNAPAAVAVAKPKPAPPRPKKVAVPRSSKTCGGSADTEDTSACKYDLRPTPRIVSIHGFANCAVVQQMPGAYGRPGEFYCVRPM